MKVMATEQEVMATEQEVQILKDLANKAVRDVARAIDTTIVLAMDTARSPMGMFLIAQRVASFMIEGSALAINRASDDSISEDDAKLLCLTLMIAACIVPEKPTLSYSKEIFKQITGREAPNLPYVAEVE